MFKKVVSIFVSSRGNSFLAFILLRWFIFIVCVLLLLFSLSLSLSLFVVCPTPQRVQATVPFQSVSHTTQQRYGTTHTCARVLLDHKKGIRRVRLSCQWLGIRVCAVSKLVTIPLCGRGRRHATHRTTQTRNTPHNIETRQEEESGDTREDTDVASYRSAIVFQAQWPLCVSSGLELSSVESLTRIIRHPYLYSTLSRHPPTRVVPPSLVVCVWYRDV